MGGVTAQPTGPAPGQDTGSYEVIHLGDHAAVVVPLADFLRLRALERLAHRAGTGRRRGHRGAAGVEGAGGSKPDLLPARR